MPPVVTTPRILGTHVSMYGYRSCPARLAAAEHECPAERYISHQVLKARPGVERLEHDLARWLRTPHGRFAAFYARWSAR